MNKSKKYKERGEQCWNCEHTTFFGECNNGDVNEGYKFPWLIKDYEANPNNNCELFEETTNAI